MPLLVCDERPQDDWTGLKDAKERRRIQTRLNVRAHRRRKAGNAQNPLIASAIGQPGNAKLVYHGQGSGDVFHEITAGSSTTEHAIFLSTGPVFYLWGNKVVSVTASSFPLSRDHLIPVIQFNLLRGIRTNMLILSMDGFMSDECEWHWQRMPLFPAVPEAQHTLQPTELQLCTPHDPVIDLVPDPTLRDNMILAAGSFDIDELYIDLCGGICGEMVEFEPKGLLIWRDPCRKPAREPSPSQSPDNTSSLCYSSACVTNIWPIWSEVYLMDHHSHSEGPYKDFFKFARHFYEPAENGQLPYWQADWADDTPDELLGLSEYYADAVDLRLLSALGANFPAIVMGKTTPVEIGMQGNFLANFHSNGLGNAEYTDYLARTVKQLTHRYSHLSTLDVGAGTAGAPKGVVKAETDFESYTFPGISSGQGFADGTYDLTVASLVLHATPFLKDTMRNVRRLLKLGSHLVLLEGTNNEAARIGTIFGAFAGWWPGAEDDRVLTPQATVPEWDRLLRESEFSGCDAITPDPDPITMPMSLIMSQAVNEKVAFLREPLASPTEMFSSGLIASDLVIVGGRPLSTCRLEGHPRPWLEQYSGNLKTVRALGDLSSVELTADTTVLSLADLDEPTFKNLSDSKWNALRTTPQSAGNVLWIIEGCRSRNRHANMTVGMVHTALNEIPALSMQLLDFQDSRDVGACTIAETLLHFKAGLMWASDESMLLSVEQELIPDRDSQTGIPRLINAQAMNEGYNSSRRPILGQTHTEVDVARLEISDPGFSLRRERNDFNIRLRG
ncbi:hypothetical protein DL768_009658 [Monosporascus sp. mg162]|nr:hypothetical protein DL768_009658 [Monosporascus sp. mg162]